MKKVRIEYEGKTYELCYTLASVAQMNVGELAEGDSFKRFYTLVKGAFLENHPDVSDAELTEIVGALQNAQGFSETLVGMFEETVNCLTGAAEEGAEKNARWAVV